MLTKPIFLQLDIPEVTWTSVPPKIIYPPLLQENWIIYNAETLNYINVIINYHGPYLSRSNLDPNNNEQQYLTITNMYLHIILANQKNGNDFHGFQLSQGIFKEAFFHKNKQISDIWASSLQTFTIRKDFCNIYSNIQTLGKGNFARVQLVKNNLTNELFAAKIFDKKLILSDNLEKNCLLNEITLLRAMGFPNSDPFCLNLLQTFEGTHAIYCLTKYYKGKTLMQYLHENKKLSEKNALKITQNLLMALKFVHSLNIIHRDVKPENIILVNEVDNEIALIDFGFACFENEFNKLFSRCGTPGYVAPEVLNNVSYCKKIDIFSAGVILYYLLSGISPFYSKSYSQVIKNNIQCQPNFEILREVFKISNETIDLLEQLLKKNPNERCTAEVALAHNAFKKDIFDDMVCDFISENIIEFEMDESPAHHHDLNERYNFRANKSPISSFLPMTPTGMLFSDMAEFTESSLKQKNNSQRDASPRILKSNIKQKEFDCNISLGLEETEDVYYDIDMEECSPVAKFVENLNSITREKNNQKTNFRLWIMDSKNQQKK